jgi:hypothetical protein
MLTKKKPIRNFYTTANIQQVQCSLLVAQVLTEQFIASLTTAGQTAHKAWVCHTAVLCTKLAVLCTLVTLGKKFDIETYCQVITDLETMEFASNSILLVKDHCIKLALI